LASRFELVTAAEFTRPFGTEGLAAVAGGNNAMAFAGILCLASRFEFSAAGTPCLDFSVKSAMARRHAFHKSRRTRFPIYRFAS
jgi:hypothetical protein